MVSEAAQNLGVWGSGNGGGQPDLAALFKEYPISYPLPSGVVALVPPELSMVPGGPRAVPCLRQEDVVTVLAPRSVSALSWAPVAQPARVPIWLRLFLAGHLPSLSLFLPLKQRVRGQA